MAYVAGESNHKLVAVDLKNRKTLAELDVAEHPDVSAYDPGLHRLYLGCEGGAVSVLAIGADGRPNKLEDVLLPRAHTVAVDPATHRLYVPLENLRGKPVLQIYEAR